MSLSARSLLLLAAVALRPFPAHSQAPTLASQIQTILADPKVSRAHWGIDVTTLAGAPLYTLNEAQYFRPASNAKLYTTAAALALLGPDATVTTRVVVHDAPLGDTVHGDLILKGAGDPNLSARHFPYVSPKDRLPPETSRSPLQDLEELAEQLVARGLRTITGDVVGDDTLFPYEPYPPDWSIDDTVWGYGAPVSALTLSDNQLTLTVTPGKTPGIPPTVSLAPAAPVYYALDVAQLNTGRFRSGSHVQIDRPLASRTLRIYGTIAADAPPDIEEIAVSEPAEYVAVALKQVLEAHGIQVLGGAHALHRQSTDSADFPATSTKPAPGGSCAGIRPVEITLAEHRSAPLAQDIVLTNKISQNLHAELLLHRLGNLSACDASTAGGVRVVRNFLIQSVKLDPDDFVFYDGSGLSGHDLTTPKATAKLLAYAATQPWFSIYEESLPVGGEDGSLVARFPKPPLKGNVHAKTGTLGESRALSGYLTAASGATLIFSIMVDNHAPRTTSDRDAIDRVVEAIAGAN